MIILLETTTLKISGMTCPMCSAAIEAGLEEQPGVKTASVSYAKEKGTVVYDTDLVQLSDLKALIKELGYSANDQADAKRR